MIGDKTDDYYISGNKLIFYPTFSKPLEMYYKLMKDFSIVIFSDLTFDLEKSVSTFNQSNCKFVKNVREIHFGFWFNKCFEAGKGATGLYFSSRYNSPLVPGKNLKYLFFGDMYDLPVQLPKNLKYLVLGVCYAHPLILPKQMMSLEFRFCAFELPKYKYNLLIPLRMKSLHLPHTIVQHVVLPESLVELHVDSYCYNIVDNTNSGLKKLVYHNGYVIQNKCVLQQKTLDVVFYYGYQ